MRNRRWRGFTLMEVLISLSLASLVLGVVLADIARDTMCVARVEPNYRALLTASAVLEKAARVRSSASESGTENGIPYSIKAQSVQADPRVFCLQATVDVTRGRQVVLSVYRLRNETNESQSGG